MRRKKCIQNKVLDNFPSINNNSVFVIFCVVENWQVQCRPTLATRPTHVCDHKHEEMMSILTYLINKKKDSSNQLQPFLSYFIFKFVFIERKKGKTFLLAKLLSEKKKKL